MSSLSPTSCDPWLTASFAAFRHARGHEAPLPPETADQRDALCAAVCQGDLARAEAICLAHAHAHPTGPSGLSALVLPTVYRIEQDWQTDQRSYADTLFAFWNLQRLVQRLDVLASARTPATAGASGGRILLATAPGEVHQLGVLVVGDLFRSHGWHASTLIAERAEVLLQAVQDEALDVLGLSVGHDATLQGLADLLRRLRACSRHPGLQIVLGGNVFGAPVRQYDWLGADHIALSATDALQFCAAVRRPQAH